VTITPITFDLYGKTFNSAFAWDGQALFFETVSLLGESPSMINFKEGNQSMVAVGSRTALVLIPSEQVYVFYRPVAFRNIDPATFKVHGNYPQKGYFAEDRINFYNRDGSIISTK
jgi:hypothetical protein